MPPAPTEPAPTDLSLLREAAASVKLVGVDMDGTFLLPGKIFPERGDELVARLRERGIIFCPASGRQYQTLADMFSAHVEGMPIIAENGANVRRDGEPLATTTLPRETSARVVEIVRELSASGEDVGTVLCGEKAYAERRDSAFLDETLAYYHANAIVPDLMPHTEGIYKIGVLSFADPLRRVIPLLETLGPGVDVVRSGELWTDVNPSAATKGTGLAGLQASLGISPAQTLCFGDFNNDIPMFEHARFSFAMANAQPDVVAAARYVAPSNAEEGVLTVLNDLFELGL